jgi:hypothetical protein
MSAITHVAHRGRWWQPAAAGRIPASVSSSVVLPVPLPPTIATSSPGSMVSETSLSVYRPPRTPLAHPGGLDPQPRPSVTGSSRVVAGQRGYILGEVRCRFFQELILHTELPGFTFELTKPSTLAHGQRRLITRMFASIGVHPMQCVQRPVQLPATYSNRLCR